MSLSNHERATLRQAQGERQKRYREITERPWELDKGKRTLRYSQTRVARLMVHDGGLALWWQPAQTTHSIIDDFRSRGLIHVTDDGQELFTPGLDEILAREKVTGYIGFDPSADSLHIGNLLGIMMLVRMQRDGHRPIAIAGGGTGLIGDPGGKSEERPASHAGGLAEEPGGNQGATGAVPGLRRAGQRRAADQQRGLAGERSTRLISCGTWASTSASTICWRKSRFAAG